MLHAGARLNTTVGPPICRGLSSGASKLKRVVVVVVVVLFVVENNLGAKSNTVLVPRGAAAP